MPNLMEVPEDMEAQEEIVVMAEDMVVVEAEAEVEAADVDEEEEVEEGAVVLEETESMMHGRSLLVESVEIQLIVRHLRSSFKALVKLLILS